MDKSINSISKNGEQVCLNAFCSYCTTKNAFNVVFISTCSSVISHTHPPCYTHTVPANARTLAVVSQVTVSHPGERFICAGEESSCDVTISGTCSGCPPQHTRGSLPVLLLDVQLAFNVKSPPAVICAPLKPRSDPMTKKVVLTPVAAPTVQY